MLILQLQIGVTRRVFMRNPVVAMSATETTYANDQVQSFDPFKKTGIIEEAMVTCILP